MAIGAVFREKRLYFLAILRILRAERKGTDDQN
jgi:hypothetical protein